MNVVFTLLFLNLMCELLPGNFAETSPEVGITSSELAVTFPEVELAFRRIGRSNLRAEEHANN